MKNIFIRFPNVLCEHIQCCSNVFGHIFLLNNNFNEYIICIDLLCNIIIFYYLTNLVRSTPSNPCQEPV